MVIKNEFWQGRHYRRSDLLRPIVRLETIVFLKAWAMLLSSVETRLMLLVELLYSWRFLRYGVPIHWLVHCHMTSNNETVSRQMP